MERPLNDYYEKGTFPARMTATTQFIDEDYAVMIHAIAYK